MTTRDRILDAALTLFNESGTSAASTNHIAAAAGISPGNLYYHFKNKEEIIAALFERIFAEHDRVFTLAEDRLPTVDDLSGLVRANFDVLWQFRFVYRELMALLRRDEKLFERWLIVRRRGYDGFRYLLSIFVAAGVIPPPRDTAAAEGMADLCWLIGEFWLASLEVGGHTVTPAELDRGVALMLQVLNPNIDPTN